ncbi:hypothetical protein LTR93_011609 [Exophiala xenobiotica]|nr:hypothetical protein LTR93_011609 [Exophiala xenobiotica]
MKMGLRTQSACEYVHESKAVPLLGGVTADYAHNSLASDTSIRLLYLERPQSEQNNVIRCSLKEVELATPPDYIAVSYTWGPPEKRAEAYETMSAQYHTIYVDSKPFQVTENLDDALIFFRSLLDVEDYPLWIDAICINQKDNDEKGRQVNMMATDWFFVSGDRLVAAGRLIIIARSLSAERMISQSCGALSLVLIIPRKRTSCDLGRPIWNSDKLGNRDNVSQSDSNFEAAHRVARVLQPNKAHRHPKALHSSRKSIMTDNGSLHCVGNLLGEGHRPFIGGMLSDEGDIKQPRSLKTDVHIGFAYVIIGINHLLL